MSKKTVVSVVALTIAAAAALAGCASGASGGGTTTGAASGGDAGAKRACVILPDSASSPRWENFDRKYLDEGLKAGGFEADIQNAEGDTSKYATIGDQQLTKGCGVMILTDYQGAAVGVAKKAKAQGVPVIAYDRSFEGSDYYVSFDNVEVGKLEGQMIVDGLKAAGKDAKTATVVYMGGDPTDNNAAMFRSGADEVMAAAGIKPAKEPNGVWDQAKSATNFQQALTSLGGKVDGVWVANDTNAAGVISVLKNSFKPGEIPVSGQDASVVGLQNILLGWQTGTVYKPVKEEADATVKVAVSLLKGEKVTADQKLDDGTPYIAVKPQSIDKTSVQKVVDAGDASASEICNTPELKTACEAAGVK